jgi:hypothetical protein
MNVATRDIETNGIEANKLGQKKGTKLTLEFNSLPEGKRKKNTHC